MASSWPPKKNTEFTLDFTLYKNDGTVIANPGTYTKKISKDGGAVADITASVTEEDTTYGQLSIVLSATEMNADRIWVQIKDDTTGCVAYTVTIYTAGETLDEVKAETAAILADTGTDGVVVASGSKTGYALTAAYDAAKTAAAAGAAMTLTAAYDAAKSAASQTSVNTIDDFLDTEVAAILAAVDTEVAAIKAKTDNLPADPADDSDIDTQLAAIAGYLDTEVAAILAAVDTEVAAIKAKTDNLPASPAAVGSQMDLVNAPNATAVTAIQSGLATAAALDAVDNFVDTEVGAIKAVTDKLDTALELDGAAYRYTTNALEQASGTGATAQQVWEYATRTITALDEDSTTLDLDATIAAAVPTAAAIADAVWDEATADHSDVGSTGAAITAAGSAGDPWATALPGSYGAGTAGKIIGDNINAPIGTVDTVVDAIKAVTDNLPDSGALTSLPTASEIRTEMEESGSALAVALYNTTFIASPEQIKTEMEKAGSHLALIKAKTDNLPANTSSVLGSPAGASLAADVAAVKSETAAIVADTNELQTNQGAWNTATGFSTHSAADVKTAIEAAGSHLTLIKAVTDAQGGTGAGLSAVPWNAAWDAEVQSEVTDALNVYDPPTKAELDAADDAVLALLGAAAGASIAADIAAVKAETASILEDTGTTIPAAITALTEAGVKKNTALSNFTFYMTDSTNHAASTGLTVTAERSLDGAAFAACANSATELSDGCYTIDLADTDLNADVVVLKFTATDTDDLLFTIKTSS